MQVKANKRIAALLIRWVALIQRFPGTVLLASLVIAGWAAWYAVGNLGVDTNIEDMLSPELEWRQDFDALIDAFPRMINTILVVIDSDLPERSEQAASALYDALREQENLFPRVEWLAGATFFRESALLYHSPEELEQLADDLARAQPMLAMLARQPDLQGLAGFMELVQAQTGEADAPMFSELTTELARVTGAAATSDSRPLSWRRLGAGPASGDGPARQIITVHPRLDFHALMPGRVPVERIRELAEDLDLTAENGVRVRLTGQTPLMHEELVSVSRGAMLAGALALVLVMLVLSVALNSWRLVFASLVALLAGLAVTAAFAAVAVDNLNLISIAFAVLYVGLGIDFAIHYCLRYRELIHGGESNAQALRLAAGDVGVSLVLCAVTTSIGFFAFFPTAFRGVAELGLISGTGMYISLISSLTVLPALLTLLPMPVSGPRPPAGRHTRKILALPERRYRLVGIAGLVIAAGAALLVPRLGFDSNPMNLRNPESESVSTFMDLMAESESPPVSLSLLTSDLETAAARARELEQFEPVRQAVSMADFIPPRQPEKLELVEQMRLILGPALHAGPATADFEARRDAVYRLHELAGAGSMLPGMEDFMAALGRFIAALQDRPAHAQEQMLARLEGAIFLYFPRLLEDLDRMLAAAPITRDRLPGAVVDNWVSADGIHRVEIFPRENIFEEAALIRFVETVRAYAPDATGIPLVNLQAGQAVKDSFRDAFLLAGGAIAVLLIVLMRSVLLAAIVLLPLVIGAILTAALAVLFGWSLSFANVIALPLLLGVGVDSGIHMVHRIRSAPPDGMPLLSTSTARAVLFSGLTTIFSFGNLALSPHPGMASMGQLLALGMAVMLAATLILLPALLAWRLARTGMKDG